MLFCDYVTDIPWVPKPHYLTNLSDFWQHQPYQCFAPRVLYRKSADIHLDIESYMELGFLYWPPYALPFIIWGVFLLSVLVSSLLMKTFKCLGYQHWTNWLFFMFAVNGSLWFWMIYFLFFEFSCICNGYDHGGWPEFFGYEDTGYYVSLIYFFLIAIIVLILIVITIYDMVTMEEGKMIGNFISPEDASEYLMTLKDSAPRQRVVVEVFHEDQNTPRYGRIEGRQYGRRDFEGTIEMGGVTKKKVVTFTEDRDFDYDTWEDPTEYPDMKTLLEEHIFVIFRINSTIEPGDAETQRILDSFKRRLVASCAYRDQRVSEQVEGIVPAMKETRMVVKRDETNSETGSSMRSCFEVFCFSCCGLWLACLFSVGAIVRVLLRTKIRRISLNIKKKYFADPANVRSYDFEASISGEPAAMYDGDAGTSLLPSKNSKNPSPVPSAPMPTYDNKDQYYQVAMVPPGNTGMADEIKRLHQLKIEGVLTEVEFSDAKQRLLNPGQPFGGTSAPYEQPPPYSADL